MRSYLRPQLEQVLHQILTKESELQLKPLSEVLPGSVGFEGSFRQLRGVCACEREESVGMCVGKREKNERERDGAE